MASLELSDNIIAVTGNVDFAALPAAVSDGERLIESLTSDRCEVNLSGLKSAGSAVLAMCLALLRCAGKQNKTLEFTRVSDELFAVIKVSGLAGVLPIHTA